MGYFLPALLFSMKENDFHPELFLSVGPPLEIIATFLYLIRLLFSPLIPDADIADLLLKDTCFFFYVIRLTEFFSFPVHCTITAIFFTKVYQAYEYFLYLFSILWQRTFPTIKFYIQLYIDSLYQGSFLRPTCQNNSFVAGKLQDPLTVVSFFYALPRTIANATSSAWHLVDLHFVLLLLP